MRTVTIEAGPQITFIKGRRADLEFLKRHSTHSGRIMEGYEDGSSYAMMLAIGDEAVSLFEVIQESQRVTNRVYQAVREATGDTSEAGRCIRY